MSTGGDRVGAGEALDMAEGQLGGRAAAKASLAEMLRDGKLQAHANRSWRCDVRDVDIAWEGRNGSDGEWDIDVDIEQDFWRNSVQWADDVNLWRWPESFFMITQSIRPFERAYFEGVSFLLADIKRVLSAHRVLNSGKVNGGRRPILLGGKFSGWKLSKSQETAI